MTLSERLILLTLQLLLIRPVRLTKEETINVLETNLASQMLHLANDFLHVNDLKNRKEPQPVSFCLFSALCCHRDRDVGWYTLGKDDDNITCELTFICFLILIGRICIYCAGFDAKPPCLPKLCAAL